MSVLGPTVTPTQLRERGWTRTNPRPWSKLRARWEGPDGWRLEHCGHSTANTPWVLIAPDGRWIRTGARFAEPPAANLGTAWPDLAVATEYVADVRAGARVLPGPEMDREGDPASNHLKAARRTRRPAAPAARPAAHEARAKRPGAPAKRPAGPAEPTAWPPTGLAPLPSVLGRMAWPDVGTYVAWSEETTERRGRQVRHGTAHLTGRVTRVTVDPVDPRDIDVWALPSRGDERRVGIAGLFVPEAKIAGFQTRAQRVYAAKLEQVQAMLGGGSAYGEAMVASNLRPEDLASAQAWPEDTLGILTQIEEHQGHGPGTKKWGANHEGLSRSTIESPLAGGARRRSLHEREARDGDIPPRALPHAPGYDRGRGRDVGWGLSRPRQRLRQARAVAPAGPGSRRSHRRRPRGHREAPGAPGGSTRPGAAPRDHGREREPLGEPRREPGEPAHAHRPGEVLPGPRRRDAPHGHPGRRGQQGPRRRAGDRRPEGAGLPPRAPPVRGPPTPRGEHEAERPRGADRLRGHQGRHPRPAGARRRSLRLRALPQEPRLRPRDHRRRTTSGSSRRSTAPSAPTRGSAPTTSR